jgi:hypothetical protein
VASPAGRAAAKAIGNREDLKAGDQRDIKKEKDETFTQASLRSPSSATGWRDM